MLPDVAAKTISTVYENGVLRPLEHLDLGEHQPVNVQILPPSVRISALAAKRKVSRFVLDEISYLMGAEPPSLQTDHLRYVWRVPVVLTYPTHGTIGAAGHIDVDAETGEITLPEGHIEEIKRNAQALAACLPSETN